MVLSDCRKIWKAALGELELQMARATFDTWLRDTHCLGVEEGNVLIVGVQPERIEINQGLTAKVAAAVPQVISIIKAEVQPHEHEDHSGH